MRLVHFTPSGCFMGFSLVVTTPAILLLPQFKLLQWISIQPIRKFSLTVSPLLSIKIMRTSTRRVVILFSIGLFPRSNRCLNRTVVERRACNRESLGLNLSHDGLPLWVWAPHLSPSSKSKRTHCMWLVISVDYHLFVKKKIVVFQRISPWLTTLRSEPAWQKTTPKSPLSSATQPVDIEEEGRTPTTDRQWLKWIKRIHNWLSSSPPWYPMTRDKA